MQLELLAKCRDSLLCDGELHMLLPTNSSSLQGVIAQLDVSCWITLCGNPKRVKGVFGLP